MKVAIVGGKLQGTEACYLGRRAGIETILIDKNPRIPASGMADSFVCADVLASERKGDCGSRMDAAKAMEAADFVLPANENDELLKAVCEICAEKELKLAFDPDAYRITQSKVRTNELMKKWGIPMPEDYPAGKPPYIIKPSGESGSKGVILAHTREEVERFIRDLKGSPAGQIETADPVNRSRSGSPDDQTQKEYLTGQIPSGWVIQEFIEGPSYSIEVIGVPGNYRTYAVTKIHMDEVYDCCKVTAPCPVSMAQERGFSDMGKRLAEMVNLHGIMDVEVMEDRDGTFKVLELDARIPSQTPAVVLESTGMNLLKELADITVYGEFRDENFADVYRFGSIVKTGDGCEGSVTGKPNGDETGQFGEGKPLEGGNHRKYAVYEHYRTEAGRLIQDGEHELSNAGPLHLSENLLGADLVISDNLGKSGNSESLKSTDTPRDFRAVFISSADDEEELEAKRRTTRDLIIENFNVRI